MTIIETPTAEGLRGLSIRRIAEVVDYHWTNVNPHARPYLDAMLELNSLHTRYGMEDADTVVLYFLDSATGWRGDVAQAVKAELGRQLKEFNEERGRHA